jgi:uncharacterized protein YkwD
VAEFRAWLSRFTHDTVLRCGLAETKHGEQHRLVIVAAEAPAELRLALPTSARVGQWLTLESELRNDAEDSRVLLLGPSGEPQTVPTSQQGRLIRARFSAQNPGFWQIQLLSVTVTGPRPMLEAALYVETPPDEFFTEKPCPGESIATSNLAPDAALEQIVREARRQTGRPALKRDAELDALALEHATSMQRVGRVGHDVGDGSTKIRLARVGLVPRLAGENVVRAADPKRAHRALWASPSHRTNLLHRGFTRWGLGVFVDSAGTLWICELFASRD